MVLPLIFLETKTNTIMEKYLVSIEFRYSDKPDSEGRGSSKSKEITIGVYDDFDEACKNGNSLLENLETKFKLHTFPDGRKVSKERFSKNGGAFNSKKTLITELAYLRTPFAFFAKITTLKYDDIDDTLNDILDATKRFKEYCLTSKFN